MRIGSFRSGLALTVVLAVGACAAQPPGVSPAPSVLPEASPGPSADPQLPGATIPGCPNFVEVVETGPMMGGENQGEFGPVMQEQGRLNADAQAAQTYGMAHPAEFGHVRFENGPWVRVVVTFTDHLAEHCAALRGLLEFPDEFQIARAEFTGSDLEAIQREVVAMAGPLLRSAGSGNADGVVDLALRADGEALAGEIAARFGDAVRITVGLLEFPGRTLPEGGGCALPLDQVIEDSPLRASVVLDPAPVASGEDFHGTVRVTNVGLTAFDFQTGATMAGSVFLPGSPDVIGAYTGGMDAMGAGARLDPLGFLDLPVVGGTASCDPALGYALPPGDYEVRVPVVSMTLHDNAPTEIGYVISDAVPLTIVP